MSFDRTRQSIRIRRTVDGGYLYRDFVYRKTSGGLWGIEFPYGFVQTVASQEKAHRAINDYHHKATAAVGFS
ncbi:MAG: hypothetical protein M3Y35_04000 [Actinomycetota bacterium]|nr:hypothetical protein [Actinomycetota bacterium]